MDTEPTTQAEQPSPQGQQTLQQPCPSCGYNLSGLPDIGNCPECNTGYDQNVLRANLSLKRTKPSLILLCLPPSIMLVLAALVYANSPNDPYLFLGLTLLAVLPASFVSCIVAPIELAVASRRKFVASPFHNRQREALVSVLLAVNTIMAVAFVLAFGACLIAVVSP